MSIQSHSITIKVNFNESSPAVKRQVDILELKDLEKEYILSRSRLTLAQHHPPSAAIAGTLVNATTPVAAGPVTRFYFDKKLALLGGFYFDM